MSSDSDSSDTMDLLSLLLILKKRKRGSKWCESYLKKKRNLPYKELVQELRLKPQDWFNYLKIDEATYLDLLSMVTPLLKKENTLMRQNITPHERLSATLQFLATGRSYGELRFSESISPQALERIIPETCNAIFRVLMPHYLKSPKNEDDWKSIAHDFEKKRQFPNCLGVLNCKHISIVAPPYSECYFTNHSGKNSIVLLAIANANYEFIFCEIGMNGGIFGEEVLERSKFAERLQDDKFNLPKPTKRADCSQLLPYGFIVDGISDLRKDFIAPYSSKNLTQECRSFNDMLSKELKILENIFSLMCSRFQILTSTMNLKIANKVVLACCALHNFLRRRCSLAYSPPESLSCENIVNSDLNPGGISQENCLLSLERFETEISPELAEEVRDEFLAYFKETGALN